ncbi:hypothetical protein A9Q99_17820 [Gammaproteobacteria bacterium 45_16_T64]|nr:hypothetical protein A9Q99_17820 [Gammaproteobacteria bacterium 45_16_T64]
MAVITRYIVERNGEEKMTFVSKKEADAYDKELDIAENLQVLLEKSDIEMDDSLLENISLYLARHREPIGLILKGSKPKAEKPKKKDATKLQAVEDSTEDTAGEDEKVA